MDKIMKTQRFDATVLWRFRLQRLELGRRNLAVEQSFLAQLALVKELVSSKAKLLSLVRRRLDIEYQNEFRVDRAAGARFLLFRLGVGPRRIGRRSASGTASGNVSWKLELGPIPLPGESRSGIPRIA